MNQAELMLKNLGKLREEAKDFIDEVPNLRDDFKALDDRTEQMFKLYFEKDTTVFPAFESFKAPKKSVMEQTHIATLMNAVVDSIRLFASSYLPKLYPSEEKEKTKAIMVVLHFAVKKCIKAVQNCDKEPEAHDPSTDLIYNYPDGVKLAGKTWELILPWAITGFDHDYMLSSAILGPGDLTMKKLAILDTIISLYPESADSKDIFGFRAIHYAARINSVEVWNRIIAMRPEAIFELSDHGETPLHVAAAFTGSEEVVTAVHAANKSALTTRTKLGQLPLHHATAFSTSVPVVNAILQAGSKELLLSTDTEGNRPLHCAAENGKYDIVDLILKANPSVAKLTNTFGMYPLGKAAVSCKSVETIKLLDEAFPQAMTESKMQGILPIHLIMSNCYSTAILEYILSRHQDALATRDTSGALPIHWLVNTPEELNLHMIDFLKIVTERYPACKSATVVLPGETPKIAYQIAKRHGVTDAETLDMLKPEGYVDNGNDDDEEEEDEEEKEAAEREADAENVSEPDSGDDDAAREGDGEEGAGGEGGEEDEGEYSDDESDHDPDATEYGMQMSRIMDTVAAYCNMQVQCLMSGMSESQATDFVLQRVQEAVRRGEVGNARLRELQEIMDKKDEEFLARMGASGGGESAAYHVENEHDSPAFVEAINKLCFRYQSDQNTAVVMNQLMSGKNEKEVIRMMMPQLVTAIRKGDFGTLMGRAITPRDLVRDWDPFVAEMRAAYLEYIEINPVEALPLDDNGAGHVVVGGMVGGVEVGSGAADISARRKVRAKKN